MNNNDDGDDYDDVNNNDSDKDDDEHEDVNMKFYKLRQCPSCNKLDLERLCKRDGLHKQ